MKDRGAWCAAVHRVAKNWVPFSDFPGGSDGKASVPTVWETHVRSLGREDPLEKEMATHSSILAWRIQWTEDPGGLQSIGLQRVGHG